jgi:hypothetical protein
VCIIKLYEKFIPDKYKYTIFPEEDGLLPWGYTDYGDELYCKDGSVIVFRKFSLPNDGKKSLPNSGKIILPPTFGSRYSGFYEYRMGIMEFLYRLFMKEVICSAFPDDFIMGTIEYNSIEL